MLAPHEIGARAIADALERVLAEPGFTLAAQRLSDGIAAMPTADEALA